MPLNNSIQVPKVLASRAYTNTTYQRAMTTLFHDMMHKEIEVYVDDMIAKSIDEEEHVEHLLKLF